LQPGRLKLSGKVVGIIGWMVPEATVDFMNKIIKNTPAEVDQDHLRVLVDNNPKIPCRVKDSIKNVALLATSTALNAKSYDKKLLEAGIQSINPYKEMIMKVIFEVKSGNMNMSKELLDQVIHRVLDKGAESIILGFAELPILLKRERFDIPFYDLIQILAQSAVKYATANKNKWAFCGGIGRK
jgi:aspartate/glutamate racemase